MGLQQILANYRKSSFSLRDQGDRFERLMKAYLLTEPRYRGLFKSVWLWNEFPSRQDFGGKDLGIDLVCKTLNGEYWAVQCKFFQSSATITKPQVDTFLSTSSRSFQDPDQFGKRVRFSHRLWIDTTVHGFNAEAELTIKDQKPAVSRINLYGLMDADVDWDRLEQGLSGEQAVAQKKTLRDHQRLAVEKSHAYFNDHDRGKLLMACGTGETFTSLKIAERETEGRTGFVLFLVPSIALLGQTLKEWASQTVNPLHAICVCSDPKVSKSEINDDFVGTSTVDLALPASTDIRGIARQCVEAQQLQQKDHGLVVIFSTYQSIEVVHNVQSYLNSEGRPSVFDMIICDEAHRTTGVTLKGENDSSFVKVHEESFLHGRKRLYMTATPRLYSEESQKKAKEKEAYLCSMDDPALYGDEIYRLGFGEAVDRHLLSDYKVIVLTLDEDQMSGALQQAISDATEGPEIPTDDALKLIGCINALSKRAKETTHFSDVDPDVMHSAVAFCQSIKNSKQTVEAMNACRDAYYKILSEEDRSQLVSIEAEHVDGTMNAAVREEKLSKLRNVPRDGNDCRVLMNVRCLSEGVDVPSLDAVLFLSSRNSQVDVVQSVGRVMRSTEGKKYGYIIIPVVIPSNVTPEEALDDNKRFAVVWTVLNALRAHDDRFNAIINKIELNKQQRPSKIIVTSTRIGSTARSNDAMDNQEQDSSGAIASGIDRQMELQFETLQSAVYAKLVEKCGDRRYWEQWASDVGKIAQRHIAQINKLIAVPDSKPQKEFARFLKGLRRNINPSVTQEDAIEMLSQHYITQPVFEALFKNYSFVQNNPVSKAMEGMVKILNEQTPKEDYDQLQRFYDSVRKRADDIHDAEGRQKVIIELYDKFFKTAFPKTVEKLGIVYTPVEVVDFIIHSVDDVLKKEFGRGITDENVHVLDPFVGTGTFITRLLQSGVIRPEDMERKYEKELHANEIVLLAYYIASINIENVYHDILAEQRKQEATDAQGQAQMAAEPLTYHAFNGICLTDTFQLGEDKNALLEDVFPVNSKRVNDQKKTPITVIIANPPYSVGQNSANDNAQNQHYPLLESQIEKYYVASSRANLNKAAYDSYIKAFRWSTDRLDPKTGGIIGFVSNGSWLDSNGLDGFRKSLEKEFSSIHVFNLRGNQRTSGELSRKEGGKVFGSGSRTPIAITILVKNPKAKEQGKIWYHAVEDYLSREEKLKECREFGSVLNPRFTRIRIIPNAFGDWVNERNSKFLEYLSFSPNVKFDVSSKAFFSTYSLGIGTNKDVWLYNFSQKSLSKNVLEFVAFYESERNRYNLSRGYQGTIRKFVKFDPTKITWTDIFLHDLENDISFSFDETKITTSLYRPFCKQRFCNEKMFIQRTYQIPKLFPTSDQQNLVICVSGVGVTKEFSCIISNVLPDLELIGKSQCFPLYWYELVPKQQWSLVDQETDEYVRHDGVTDFILKHAKEKYGPRVVKEDIFYYVYGILHVKSYREKFSSDLKKTLPRLPLVSEPRGFWEFSKAGRALAKLHLEYETIQPCPGVTIQGAESGDFEVTQMRFPSKGQKDTILYNKSITVSNIPAKAYEYVVNGKSAIEWVMERYAVTVDKKSGIKNDPNDWAKEHQKPRYILDLLLSVINVSVQTVDIVNTLPDVDWDKE
jgi:predicted helicase